MTAKQVAIRLKTDGKAEVKRDLAEIGSAGSQAQDRLASSTDKATQAADRQMAKWKQMAAAARQAQEAQERQAAFNSALGVDGGSGKSAADSAAAFMAGGKGRGLTTMQRQTLVYTASDVFASAASGMNPGMIAMQQGPQVLQAWAVGGNAASGSMWKLAAGVGGVTAAVVAATAAWSAHRSTLAQLTVVTQGMGATAGLTAGKLELMANAAAKSGEITAASAREMATAYLSTGRIGGEVTERLIGLTRRYALATSQDAAGATKELAQAFADPAKGAEILNSKLQLLDGKTADYIRTLVTQNQTTKAQIELAKALDQRLASTAQYVSVLGNAWEKAKVGAINFWNAAGRAVDLALGGGSAEDRLSAARKELKNLGAGRGTQKRRDELSDTIKQLESEIAGASTTGVQRRSNQLSQDARDAIDRANPNAAAMRAKQADLALIQSAIDQGVGGPGAAKAVANLKSEIHALANGYKTATGEASALARQQRQAAAAARKAAQEALKDAKEDNRLAELKADNELTVIKLKMGQRGDYDLTTLRAQAEELERQIRLRQLVAQFVGAGVDQTKALAMAERQLGEESKATWQGMVSDASKAIDGFVSTAAAMKKVGEQVARINQDQDAINSMGQVGAQAFDRLSDRLVNSGRAFESWRDTISSVVDDIKAEFLRLALVNPIKNALFGNFIGYNKAPVISGLGSFFSGLFGRNADGTDNWRGGLTWVGERGPELVNLPRGSQVFSNTRSAAMAAGGPNIHITLNAQGAGPNEVDALRRELRSLKAELPSLVVGTVNDAKSRRFIK